MILSIRKYFLQLLVFILLGTMMLSCNNKNDKSSEKKQDSLATEKLFPPDTIDGIYHEYYKTGKIKIQGPMENRKRVGDWSAFYDDGKVWSTGNYENGMRTGYACVYFPNGVKQMEGNYKDNKPIGIWKYYNKKGEKTKEETK